MFMQREECSNCGAQARIIRGDYLWRDVDLPVTLRNVEQIQCEKCGNVDVVIPRLAQLMRTIALAVIHKPYRLRGEEVRFLRKYLGMTGADFSALLKVDKTTLSKWENNEDPVGEQSDRLIRMVALGLGEGLQGEIGAVVRAFTSIHSNVKKVGIRVDPKTMVYEYELGSRYATRDEIEKVKERVFKEHRELNEKLAKR
jgi:DNA-binding transcriptional regulator YiaG